MLFCTCDAYEDLWMPFFALFSKYWEECNFDIIINTETKHFKYEGLNILTNDDNRGSQSESYGKRMIRTLNQISSKYTLLMLDDFFLRRSVNTHLFEEFINIMDQHREIAAIYLTPGYTGGYNISSYDNRLNELNQFAMYKLNMQASIWRTDKLKEYWDEKDDPWTWEIFANYTTFHKPDVFLQVIDFESSPLFYGYNPNGMGVFRGKWVKDDVVPLFETNNISVDYSTRGFYDAENISVKHFNNKVKLFRYMKDRIGLKYTFGFFIFYIKKKIFNMLHLKCKYDFYPDQLQAKYEKGR